MNGALSRRPFNKIATGSAVNAPSPLALPDSQRAVTSCDVCGVPTCPRSGQVNSRRLSSLVKARELEQENRGLVNDSPATATCSVGRIGNELQGHTLRSGSVSPSIFIHLHLASLALPLPFLSSLETLVERSSSPCRNFDPLVLVHDSAVGSRRRGSAAPGKMKESKGMDGVCDHVSASFAFHDRGLEVSGSQDRTFVKVIQRGIGRGRG